MENRINHFTGGILAGFTCLLALALIVNAAQAMAGKAIFAYWHWMTLVVCIYFCRKAISWVTFARWAVRIRQTRKQATVLTMRTFSNITRAAHGLAALFTHIQTEP
jgi:hypothetical protein